jgi:diguanylate cyclase (GGDEF)-like protein
MHHHVKARLPQGDWRRFLLHLSVLGVLLVMGLFSYFIWRDQIFLEYQLLARGRAVVEGLTLIRHWNASHGGIYVKGGPDFPANPYLHLPDLVTDQGEVLRPVHPAEMTRQLSAFARDQRLFTFHLFSDRPVNPQNTAESFELEAIQAFRQGRDEVARHEGPDEGNFVYVAPLRMEAACLPCHQQQGYKEGDIRGGVSVRYEVGEAAQVYRRHKTWALGLGAAAAVIFLVAVNLLVWRLGRSVGKAQAKLEEQAMRDELTGLANRRHFYERLGQELKRARRHSRPLALAMIDLDHFKQVNDEFGHWAGDRVLRRAAKLIQEQCRAHDTVARYGGEEFTVILPETGREGALALAEKLRAAVEAQEFKIGPEKPLRLTISLGLVSLEGAEQNEHDVDAVINRADLALYQAKEAGRNRTALFAAQEARPGAGLAQAKQ